MLVLEACEEPGDVSSVLPSVAPSAFGTGAVCATFVASDDVLHMFEVSATEHEDCAIRRSMRINVEPETTFGLEVRRERFSKLRICVATIFRR